MTCHVLIVLVPTLQTCMNVPGSRPDEPSSLQKVTKIVMKSDYKLRVLQCDPEETQGRGLSALSLLENSRLVLGMKVSVMRLPRRGENYWKLGVYFQAVGTLGWTCLTVVSQG